MDCGRKSAWHGPLRQPTRPEQSGQGPLDRMSKSHMNQPIARRSFLALAAAPLLRGLPIPKIKDVRVIATEPAGVRLVVVKITTDQDGLYGYGCATFTQRADLVRPAVEQYLKPLLLGRAADRIEDTWQSCYDSSYWKNGPVLNNAISGVDEAL